MTVEVGSTFTAHVPEKGYPLPISADTAVVTVVARGGREERFRAVAAGSTTLDVLSGSCYRAPIVRPSRGIAPTPLRYPPAARCSILSVHVSAAR
ncbi:hypothetical protein [Actinoallomurus acanthiterrae]